MELTTLRKLEAKERKLIDELQKIRKALKLARELQQLLDIAIKPRKKLEKTIDKACEYPIREGQTTWKICNLPFKAATQRAKYCPTHQNIQRHAVLEAKAKRESNV